MVNYLFIMSIKSTYSVYSSKKFQDNMASLYIIKCNYQQCHIFNTYVCPKMKLFYFYFNNIRNFLPKIYS